MEKADGEERIRKDKSRTTTCRAEAYLTACSYAESREDLNKGCGGLRFSPTGAVSLIVSRIGSLLFLSVEGMCTIQAEQCVSSRGRLSKVYEEQPRAHMDVC